MRRCPRSRRMHPPPTRRARRPRVTALLQPVAHTKLVVSNCGSALRQLRWVGNPLINAAPNPNKNVQAFKRSEAVPRDLARGTSFFLSAVVRVPFGSLLVQRDRYDTYWGPKKIFFLIREIDDAAMAGASMESCQFVVLRSPRGRIGSILNMRNRLRRLRRRFKSKIHLPWSFALYFYWP